MKSPKSIAVVLFLLSLAAFPLRQKIRSQNADRSVEVCVSLQDTLDLLNLDLNNSSNFLERCRLMGVRSIAVREETLRDWIDHGKATTLSQSEYEKFKSLGLSQGDLPGPSSLWLSDSRGSDALLAALLIRYPAFSGKIKTKKLGGYFFINRPEGVWEKDFDLRLGFNPETVARLKEVGLSPVYALEEQGRGTFPDSTRVGFSTFSVSAWLFTGIPDAAAKKSVIGASFRETLKQSQSKFILLENINAPLIKRMSSDLQLTDRVLKGHTISVDEMKNLEPSVIIQRYARAAKERSVRFIYYRWNPHLSAEINLGNLRCIFQDLKSHGFIFESVTKNSILNLTPVRKIRIFLAFLLAVAGPCAGALIVRAFLREPENQGKLLLHAWLVAVCVAVLFGISISLLLPDADFVNGLETFQGVKASIVLPLILIGGIFFSMDEWFRFLKREVTVRDALMFLILSAAFIVLLSRSGNFSGAVHPAEISLRNWIENFLTVRPRFKEFAIGHPLLILGIFLWPNYRNASKMLMWAGSVGLVSIVNTFCHLHTPVAVSLLRSFHGFWLGGILGILFILLFRVFDRRPSFRRAMMEFGS